MTHFYLDSVVFLLAKLELRWTFVFELCHSPCSRIETHSPWIPDQKVHPIGQVILTTS